MTKQQKEIIITIVLLLIFITVFSTSFKKIKSAAKGRVPKPETTLKEEALKESASVDTREEMPKETEETQGKKRDSQVRLIPLIKWTGDWKRDPFILPKETIALQSILRSILKEEENPPGPLTGIVWKEGGPLALIGDSIVRKGETVESYRVVEINRSRVTLEKAGKTYELFLEEE